MIDLKILRALSETQIETLEKKGDSDELFYAQIIGKILEDENCFAVMEVSEIEKMLVMLGFKNDIAHVEAVKLKSLNQ
ncbi:MAG: hypothetical protein MJ054_00070 [Clostridia bacterium]|nr:hypothetical protein [Clostridia bacterium]